MVEADNNNCCSTKCFFQQQHHHECPDRHCCWPGRRDTTIWTGEIKAPMSRITARAFKPSENFFRRARLTGITQRKFSFGSASIAKTLRRQAFRKPSNVTRNNLNVNQRGVSWLSSTTDDGIFMDDFGDSKLKERHDYYEVSEKVARELRKNKTRGH